MTVPQQAQFTASEVSRIARISESTIRRCVRDGSIRVITIPGSRHRRVTRDALIQFLKAMGHEIEDPT